MTIRQPEQQELPVDLDDADLMLVAKAHALDVRELRFLELGGALAVFGCAHTSHTNKPCAKCKEEQGDGRRVPIGFVCRRRRGARFGFGSDGLPGALLEQCLHRWRWSAGTARLRLLCKGGARAQHERHANEQADEVARSSEPGDMMHHDA